MSLLSALKSALLRKKPLTAEYRPQPSEPVALRVDELPPFNLRVADLMRFDSQVRIALGARNGLLMAAEVEVIGEAPEIVRWVQTQWDRLWSSSAHQLLRTKLYGFLPFEVMYRQVRGGAFDGALVVDHLKDRHPRDARVLVHEGQIVGFALRVARDREVEVLAPKALVCTFDSEFGNPYGCALLERAYPAWYEKWMDGGAKKTLRLRMIKDAYIGDIFWYPPDRAIELPGGRSVSWRDIAREVVEARLSGGAMALPLVFDASGNKLVDYTPPQDVSGATHVFQWKQDVDLEIWKALEVPPEIIEAASVGSGYSGRSIPFMVALSAVQVELAELVRSVDRDILRPLAQLNFATVPDYEIRPRPLVETYFQQKQTPRSQALATRSQAPPGNGVSGRLRPADAPKSLAGAR